MKDFFEISEITSKVSVIERTGSLYEFTEEDKFYKHLDIYYSDKEFLDFFPDVISYDNIVTEKKLTKGEWIKIKTDDGYEVHYATPFKIRDKYFLQRRIDSNFKKIEKLTKIGNTKEIQRLESEKIFFESCIFLDLKPYFVSIKRNGKNEYLLPYQYEFSNGIEVYQECINVKGITYKTHYKNNQDKEKIFYLQQRGISKEVAIILSKLKDTYFIINLKEMFDSALKN